VSRGAFISGVGGHLPPRVVTNDDLTALGVVVPRETFAARTGIRERRYADEGIGAGDLAVPASQAAIASAGLRARDIDIVIMATLSGEQAFPGSALFLQRQLGLFQGEEPKAVATMDIRNQGAGFLFGLSTAVAMVGAGAAQHALVVGSEVQSALLDFSSRGSAATPLFGDGAGAVVVSASGQDADRGIRRISLGTDSRGADSFFVNLWRVRNRPYLPLVAGRESDAIVPAGDLWPKLDYEAVIATAIDRIAAELAALVAPEGMTPSDLDLIVLQQTSAEVGRGVADRLHLSPEKILGNVEKYADTSAAAIPLALSEAQGDGRLRRGMRVAMVAFGAGYVWGAALCDW